MNLILDSGSSYLIITDLNKIEELELRKGNKVYLKGLGKGFEIEAYFSGKNHVSLGKIQNPKTNVVLLIDSGLNLSQKLGVPIHGIIGYEVFKDLVIDINYKTQRIKFYDPDFFYQTKQNQIKRYAKAPLQIINKKSYINAKGVFPNGNKKNLNLLIDTGSWSSFWLFPNDSMGIQAPKNNIEDFLGYGLSGEIHGKRSRLTSMNIVGFDLLSPTASFPHSIYTGNIQQGPRNGTVGADVLRRFRVVFDYTNQIIYLKQNKDFKQEYHYNMAGIELSKPFDLPIYQVVYIRNNSPAQKAGLKEGDIIQSFNNQAVAKLSLSEINHIFHHHKGKKITLGYTRGNLGLNYASFILVPVI